MKLDHKVEITIKDTKTGNYIIIPVLPEVIEYTSGDALATSVNIINLGTVDIPNGKDLDSVSWGSFFPARYDASYCSVKAIKKPLEYKKLFEGWKNTNASLQLICPAAGINKRMYLKSFVPILTGFEGDIDYTLTLRELVIVKPVKVKLNTTTLKRATNNVATRTKVPTTTKPTTYTVKAGDTLAGIAKKLGINPWQDLYTKNKKAIGANPSNIKVGQVLTL